MLGFVFPEPPRGDQHRQVYGGIHKVNYSSGRGEIYSPIWGESISVHPGRDSLRPPIGSGSALRTECGRAPLLGWGGTKHTSWKPARSGAEDRHRVDGNVRSLQTAVEKQTMGGAGEWQLCGRTKVRWTHKLSVSYQDRRTDMRKWTVAWSRSSRISLDRHMPLS